MGRVGKSSKDSLPAVTPPPAQIEVTLQVRTLMSQTPTFWAFGGQTLEHSQYLPSSATLRPALSSSWPSSHPSHQGSRGLNGMRVSMARLEAMGQAGGLPLILQVHTSWLQACAQGTRLWMKKVQWSRDQSRPCRCLTTEQSVWTMRREPRDAPILLGGHLSMHPGMTRRSDSRAPHPT